MHTCMQEWIHTHFTMCGIHCWLIVSCTCKRHLVVSAGMWQVCCQRQCTTQIFTCWVSDTSSTEVLSLNSRQSDLSHKLISHLKDIGIDCRLPRVRSSQGGKWEQMSIQVCAVGRSVPRSQPTVLSRGKPDPSSLFLPRSRHSDILIVIDTNLRRQYVTLCCSNAQSVAGNRSDKRSEIELCLRNESVDIWLLSETWFVSR